MVGLGQLPQVSKIRSRVATCNHPRGTVGTFYVGVPQSANCWFGFVLVIRE